MNIIDNKHLITKYAVKWELDPRKCNSEPFLRKNWETSGVSNSHHLINFFKLKRFEF